MNTVSLKLTVFFDEPFWVGVLELKSGTKLAVCKHTFGSEPKEDDIKLLLTHYSSLRFSPMIDAKEKKDHCNPKRLQREAKKQVEQIGIGTKSQQALKLLQEQNKLVRKKQQHQLKQEKKEYLYDLKKQKRKAKHKGR